MFTVKTSRFGAIDVTEDSVVEFPDGLLGLHQYRKYVFIERKASPLRWMQSLDMPDLAFLVADPHVFDPEYRAEVHVEDISSLPTADPRHLAMGVICTVTGDPSDATVNLKAPLIIDINSRRGKQVVLNESDYSIHHPWPQSVAA